VFDLVGEILEGADRNALLGRVAGSPIILCEVRDDHLWRRKGGKGGGGEGDSRELSR